MTDVLRWFAQWMHEASAKWSVFSWAIHGIMALPLLPIAMRWPWTTPGLVFFYREAEQVWHRFRTRAGYVWVDHVMDVLIPGVVGLLMGRLV